MTELFIRPCNESSEQPINIAKCEEHYNATFVGDFCIKDKYGNWSEMPVAIFYVPNPDTSLGHTHYFGLFVQGGDMLCITKGDSAFEKPIVGIVADDGEVIFSRYRHDYVQSNDKSVFIDGGRDYTKFGGGHHRLVRLVINKDKLELVPESVDVSIKNPLTS